MTSEWLASLGVTDSATGLRAAKDARDKVLEPAQDVLGSEHDVTPMLLIFQGFVARAQGLHEGSVQMAEIGNPHGAFTLLRAYAENAAAIVYARDHPTIASSWLDIDGHGVQVGRITNHARRRFRGFKGVYDELSKYAHPQALGILASTRITDDTGPGKFEWSSAPAFKRPDDQLLAYAWVIELATATHHVLYEFAETYRLGRFANVSDHDT